MRPINRPWTPQLNPMAYQTFALSQPIATHFRPATCAEAGCGNYRNGWVSKFDEATELGQRQAYYVRKVAGRRFTESRDEAGLTVFTFEAGQACFASGEHRVPLERPVNHHVWRGDWRHQPRRDEVTTMHGEDWIDMFANHQDKLHTALERG